MNKLTKSELIRKIRGQNKVKCRPDPLIEAYNDAISCALDIIRNTEIIPDPVPVDTELEEAKKRFPVGSWFTFKGYGSALFKVKEVARASLEADCCNIILVKDDSEERYKAEFCTPATLPTAAKWRCMKTDMPEYETVLTNLDGRYYPGWYLPGHKCWSVNRILVDLSRYDTALWLEIPRGE